MKDFKHKGRGTWIHRFAIWFFSIVLTFLFLWLLGYILKDVKTIRAPSYEEIEKKYVDRSLFEKSRKLDENISSVKRRINRLQGKQEILGNSIRALQGTIGQLLDVKKTSMQKDMALSEEEQKSFTESLNLFLENQRRYQEINREISRLDDEKNELEAEKRSLDRSLREKQKPAREEHKRLKRRHEIRLAAIQIAILLPILIAAAWLFLKKRGSLYFPIVLSLGIATLGHFIMVIHEYFPRRVFRYILLLAFLAVIVRVLVHFIRAMAFPKTEWILKQYREAYQRFVCPVCGYPIRRGPLKYLFWNRRTAKKIAPPLEGTQTDEEYICPSCGAALFEECESCHKIRHSLLPHCEHCGAKKEPV